jgi:perosamine synthetase
LVTVRQNFLLSTSGCGIIYLEMGSDRGWLCDHEGLVEIRLTSKLAIEGGLPVRATLLPYARQMVDDDDRKAVEHVLKGDWLTTGPAVATFESALCRYTGIAEAVAVNSGTAALHASVSSLGIGLGDEVIVPAITFVASANCVLYTGGTPVFADVSPDTLNIDPKSVERLITRRTKAIVAVDFAGHPCDHDALREIASRHGLRIISDAAHSLGATYRDRKVGTLQDLTALSFHPVKLVTTGEGGAVLTDDVALAKTIRSFRHHGVDLDLHARNGAQTWAYDVAMLGYNYRIPDINCALGTSQIGKLDDWISRRRQLAKIYKDALGNNPLLQIPAERSDCRSAWHLYVVRIRAEALTAGRAEIFAALRAENIGVNVHYIPVPWLSYYEKLGYIKGNWPIAEAAYERIISIPLFPGMTDEDAADVVLALHKVLQRYRR